MHCVRYDAPTEWATANVYILADLHIGDPNCDLGEVHDRIKRIQDDPCGLCVLNGDLLNTATRGGISDVYGDTLSPMQQITEMIGLLRPIADKVVSATTGNHESRVYHDDGVDTMRLVCRELGIEERYCPEGVLAFLRFGLTNKHQSGGAKWDKNGNEYERNPRKLFTIYSTHGSGGGRKEGGKAIRLAELADIVDADIYLMSHVHTPMILRERYFRTDVVHSMAKPVDRLFVCTGASLDYGGYAQSKAYKPASLKTPYIRLTAKSGHAEAIL